jgi:hypothetical protein
LTKLERDEIRRFLKNRESTNLIKVLKFRANSARERVELSSIMFKSLRAYIYLEEKSELWVQGFI